MKRVNRSAIEKIDRTILVDRYLTKKYSVFRISKEFHCSQNKINYWLKRYGIEKRSISDAIYHLKNPSGDPFSLYFPTTVKEGILFGLGLGLYWGEGTKRGKGGMRITNTDAKMMKVFVEFLEKFLQIDRSSLRFSLLIFQDLNEKESLKYWSHELNVDTSQFYKTMKLKIRGEGTYKYRSEHGVIIVQLNNVKLKKLICDMIENIGQIVYS